MKELFEVIYKDSKKIFTRLHCEREFLKEELEKSISFHNKYHNAALTRNMLTIKIPEFFGKKFYLKSEQIKELSIY